MKRNLQFFGGGGSSLRPASAQEARAMAMAAAQEME